MSLDFLVEMGWKSALIAAVALAAGLLLKSRSAQDKAAMLRLAVGLILLLPAVSLMGPALRMENPLKNTMPVALSAPQAGGEDTAFEAGNPSYVLPATADASDAQAPAVDSAPNAFLFPFLDRPELVAGFLYLAGVLVLGLRLLGGYVTLQRWTWSAQEVDCPHWRKALDRARKTAGESRGARLLLSDSVPAPLSWGWAQPVILIDPETFERRDDAEAVLAHEVAHVVRADWLALMLSRLAVVFFWFNPFIWWLEREMVQQSEEAADARAVAEVEPAQYAQTLMSCVMHSRGGVVPANSIRPSRSGLSRRIYAVLDGRARAIRSGSRWTLAAMVGCIAFAAPLAALELTAPEPPQAPNAPDAPEAPPVTTRHETRIVHYSSEDGSEVVEPVAPVPPVAPVAMGRGRMAPVQEIEAAKAARVEAQAAAAQARALAQLQNIGPHVQAAVQSAQATAIASVDGEAIAIAVQKDARKAVASGSRSLEKGAADLRNGARDLRREADRLRDPSYRERQIAKARAEGRTVTHEELIEAIPGLREGAKDMEEGADDMIREAREMREGH